MSKISSTSSRHDTARYIQRDESDTNTYDMDHRQYHLNGNQKSQKRRGEGSLQQEPPAKKSRPEDGYQQRPLTTNFNILPHPPPVLPPISPEYEQVVFTHPSMTAQANASAKMLNYDRLEFLGDAYIEIVASRMIFDTFKDTSAGGMCGIREKLVKNETLCKYAVMYGFDKRLAITQTPKDTAKGWLKVYGDVFEAYAAAIVLSHPEDGQARLKSWLMELWKPILDQASLPKADVQAKQALAKKISYNDVKINYVEERPVILTKGRETYFIGVYLDGWGWKNQHLGSGQGPSKGVAGQEAARMALGNHPLIDEIIAIRNDAIKARQKEQEEKAQVEDSNG